jgi:hypothetical protein
MDIKFDYFVIYFNDQKNRKSKKIFYIKIKLYFLLIIIDTNYSAFFFQSIIIEKKGQC